MLKNNPFIQEVDDVRLIEFYWKLLKLEKTANYIGLFLAGICLIGFVIAFSYNIYNVVNFITILVSWFLLGFMLKYFILKVFRKDVDEFFELDGEALKRLEIFDRAIQKGQKVYINIKTGQVFIKEKR